MPEHPFHGELLFGTTEKKCSKKVYVYVEPVESLIQVYQSKESFKKRNEKKQKW